MRLDSSLAQVSESGPKRCAVAAAAVGLLLATAVQLGKRSLEHTADAAFVIVAGWWFVGLTLRAKWSDLQLAFFDVDRRKIGRAPPPVWHRFHAIGATLRHAWKPCHLPYSPVPLRTTNDAFRAALSVIPNKPGLNPVFVGANTTANAQE